ncbi:hypothetical protein PIROE2DRAFT_5822 [Piromyces sp. E2]|nr:hypothetical protein PIROE2DRAFT_5822 [Piromyces sp. E2]|eukprot:OUM66842.1 hypothetical protein PIROE2DRAFT_5822 [Piromyces sp. E2]
MKNNFFHKKLNDFEVSVFDDLNENSLFRYDESTDEVSSDVFNYSYISNGEKFILEEEKKEKKEEKIILEEEKEKMNKKEIVQKESKIKIDVTLEELYVGVEKKVKIERKIICPECFGKRQNYVVCDNCLGNGYTYNINLEREVICTLCNGIGKKRYDIFENKDKYIIATINVLPHSQFISNGNDLIINVTISLKEALCGLNRIMTNPGEVISPHSIKCYKNKGLVKNVSSKEKGNLKIKFFVQFPENNWTTLEDIKTLEKILSKKPSKNDKYVSPEELAEEDLDINLNEYPSPVSVKSNLTSNSLSEKLSMSPSEKLSPASIKSSISLYNTNTRLFSTKKSPIDQFYLCDINSGRNRNPRTISVAEPSFDIEHNPPRTISVIDSMIMPIKGEEEINNSLSSSNDDLYKGDFERSLSLKSDIERRSPSFKSDIERRSPSFRSLRKFENCRRPFYSDDESFKNIKVISPKSLKSPKEMELIDKNKNVISNNRNEIVPPPLPPFPKNQKQLSHTRNVSLERTFINNKNVNQFNSQPKPKLTHSNTFHEN